MNQAQQLEALQLVKQLNKYADGTVLAAADEIIRLHARVQELETEVMHAMSEASNVARSLFSSHYSHEHAYSSGRITWDLCDDVRGVISQISNMCVGLVRDIEPERDHSDEDDAIAAGKVQAAVQGRVG